MKSFLLFTGLFLILSPSYALEEFNLPGDPETQQMIEAVKALKLENKIDPELAKELEESEWVENMSQAEYYKLFDKANFHNKPKPQVVETKVVKQRAAQIDLSKLFSKEDLAAQKALVDKIQRTTPMCQMEAQKCMKPCTSLKVTKKDIGECIDIKPKKASLKCQREVAKLMFDCINKCAKKVFAYTDCKPGKEKVEIKHLMQGR